MTKKIICGKDERCDQCGCELPKGSYANIEDDETDYVYCDECIK